MTAAELATVNRARRMLRYLWQQGFRPKLDALEYDEVYEIMAALDAIHIAHA